MTRTDQHSRGAATAVRERQSAARRGWLAAARRVHFLAGVLVAPVLAVLCLTGLAYVFSPQIHNDLYHTQLFVEHADGPPHPVSEQVAVALAAHPEGKLRSVVPPPEADRTTRVVLSVPGQDGAGDSAPARTVYVDPYTNRINGELTTIGNRLPANTWLRDLHSNLHLGEVGRVYSELAASWLPFIVLGGVALWIGQRRRKTRLRELLLPRARGKGWARLRAVHGPLGLWLTAGLLVLSIAGLSMSQYAGGRADQGVNPLDARSPTLAAAPVAVPANAAPIGVDRALAITEAEGLRGELLLTPPSAADAPFTVAEKSNGLPIQRDSIAIDPYTATVTERIGWSDYSLLAKLSNLGAQAHTGTLFGLANQIVLALLVIGTLVLLGLGYRMWWKRGPYRGKLPAPAPPSAWRHLPRPAWVLLPLAAAALGWVMPVFGVSLVGFLILDAVITTIKRRRQPIPSPRHR